MAKKKPDFRVWIDGELHAPLSQLAKEHASTVPRQANRILRNGLYSLSPVFYDKMQSLINPQAKIHAKDLKTKAI